MKELEDKMRTRLLQYYVTMRIIIKILQAINQFSLHSCIINCMKSKSEDNANVTSVFFV